jgi:hypothetical protein
MISPALLDVVLEMIETPVSPLASTFALEV